ncbi:MAG: MFS transporter [Bacteroidota bacterium]
MANEKSLLKDRNLYIIFSITLIGVMGVSSITPAFPEIAGEFDITKQQVGYLISVFTLPGIFLTPFLGILADRLGRKKVLVPALLLFGVAGFACFFARDFKLLLLFRFIQGVGAASIGSLNVTLIGDLYSGKQRGTAMGYNGSVLSVGTAAYPAIGGALAAIGWYFPFILPVLGIMIGFIVMRFLKNPEPKNNMKMMQYLGNTLMSMYKFKVLTVFLGSITFFIIIYGAFLTYFPFLMEEKFGAPVYVIGVVMSGTSIFAAITSSQLGKLFKLFSYRTLLLISFALYIISLLIVPIVPNIFVLLVPSAILGIANGINMPVVQTLLAGLAPMEYRGAFMSVNGMVLRLGQTLGPLYTGIFYGLWGLKGAFLSAIVPVLIVSVMVHLAFNND